MKMLSKLCIAEEIGRGYMHLLAVLAQCSAQNEETSSQISTIILSANAFHTHILLLIKKLLEGDVFPTKPLDGYDQVSAGIKLLPNWWCLL